LEILSSVKRQENCRATGRFDFFRHRCLDDRISIAVMDTASQR
jgi:hypothetical protein